MRVRYSGKMKGSDASPGLEEFDTLKPTLGPDPILCYRVGRWLTFIARPGEVKDENIEPRRLRLALPRPLHARS
jgi:hypothetical protein